MTGAIHTWTELSRAGLPDAGLPRRGLARIPEILEGAFRGSWYLRHLLRREADTALEGMRKFSGLEDEKLREMCQEQSRSIFQSPWTLTLRSLLRPGTSETRDLLASCLGLSALMSQRTLAMTPFKEQILGALGLCRGYLMEMATGEGKTLAIALAAIPMACTGRPLHIITANDYLARRDAHTMAPLFQAWGLTVSSVTGEMDPAQRRQAHVARIVYTTARELVADYLRDTLYYGPMVNGEKRLIRYLARGVPPEISSDSGPIGATLRGIHFVIADEADHLLIDEAQTPLIISRPTPDPLLCRSLEWAMKLADLLIENSDYRVFKKEQDVRLTDQGKKKLSAFCDDFGRAGNEPTLLDNPAFAEELVCQALRAAGFFHRDKQYIVVKDEKKIAILDQGTGRIMPSRSWSRGLHQIIEAREGFEMSPVTNSAAGLSFQNFFRRVPFLSGVTGTAWENRAEFWHLYKLRVLRVPTHRPCIRAMEQQRFYSSSEERRRGISELIRNLHANGAPVLVGTNSLRESEILAEALGLSGIEFQLLNALKHEQEAGIIALAGRHGAVTIATNMAGRGTDILLDAQALEAGGLQVISAEKNLACRVDRQLYGRCARQGDPGRVHQLISLDERVFTRFLPDALLRSLQWLKKTDLLPDSLLSVMLRLCQRSAESQARMARVALMRQDRWMAENIF